MNSLDRILSARVSPPQTPTPSRSNSYGNILSSATAAKASRRNSEERALNEKAPEAEDIPEAGLDDDQNINEETALIGKEYSETEQPEGGGWLFLPRKISIALLDSMRWIVSTLVSPGVYLIACLYDERGYFAPFSQFRKLIGGSRRSSDQVLAVSSTTEVDSVNSRTVGKSISGGGAYGKGSRNISSNSSYSGISSESESDRLSETEQPTSGSSRHTRSKTLQTSDEIAPARRSIRIKLHNEDTLRQRKHRKTQTTSSQSNGSGAIAVNEISPATLKSPTSPAASLLMTKYPRAPAPPRPLIPRRQPSYTLQDSPSGRLTQKTLILDLDETLIHSMAKGGRMSTGHMVEVKLNTMVAAGGGATLGPQHPILYYVHKRPHCDDFLRRVSKSTM